MGLLRAGRGLAGGCKRAEDRRQRGKECLGHGRGGGHLLAHHAIQPRHRLGGFRVGGHRRPLLLPQIEIAAREILEIGRFGHGAAV